MTITLATLADATAQEVFDQVVTHLLTQNKKSQNSVNNCLYRNGEGLACAAGCLISEEEMVGVQATGSNGVGWIGLIRTMKLTENHKALISKLQNIHDDSHPEDWEEDSKSVAEARNLQFNWVKPA